MLVTFILSFMRRPNILYVFPVWGKLRGKHCNRNCLILHMLSENPLDRFSDLDLDDAGSLGIVLMLSVNVKNLWLLRNSLTLSFSPKD